MKLHASKTTDAQRGKSVVVFQAAKRALHGTPAPVEIAEPTSVARDARVEASCFPPRN